MSTGGACLLRCYPHEYRFNSYTNLNTIIIYVYILYTYTLYIHILYTLYTIHKLYTPHPLFSPYSVRRNEHRRRLSAPLLPSRMVGASRPHAARRVDLFRPLLKPAFALAARGFSHGGDDQKAKRPVSG